LFSCSRVACSSPHRPSIDESSDYQPIDKKRTGDKPTVYLGAIDNRAVRAAAKHSGGLDIDGRTSVNGLDVEQLRLDSDDASSNEFGCSNYHAHCGTHDQPTHDQPTHDHASTSGRVHRSPAKLDNDNDHRSAKWERQWQWRRQREWHRQRERDVQRRREPALHRHRLKRR
jgi:hypothetical protein